MLYKYINIYMVQIQYSVHKYPIHAPIIAKFFPQEKVYIPNNATSVDVGKSKQCGFLIFFLINNHNASSPNAVIAK